MFRTRDFVLVLVTVAFLIIAILYTVTDKQKSLLSPSEIVLVEAEVSGVTSVVTSSADVEQTRNARIEEWRKKIADSELVTIGLPDESVVFSTETPSNGVFESVALEEPLLCPSYTEFYLPQWPVDQIETREIEGVKQFTVTATLQTGSTSSSAVAHRQLLQLPLRTISMGQRNCLPSDVIGVALDNSLIRNNETALYGIFNDQTIIGHALDGYPIYGQGTSELDECGGRSVNGAYRYEIKQSQPAILYCYRGIPQLINGQI